MKNKVNLVLCSIARGINCISAEGCQLFFLCLAGNSQEASHTHPHSRKLTAGLAVVVATKVAAIQAGVGRVTIVARGLDIGLTSCFFIFIFYLEPTDVCFFVFLS